MRKATVGAAVGSDAANHRHDATGPDPVRPNTQDSQESHIAKGFILLARAIEDSEIAHFAPCTRELWILILRKASHKDSRCGGKTIRRGQWWTDYATIQEALHWRVGFRRETYSRDQIKVAMKQLRSHLMATTRKTTRGLLITVCNYDIYQNPMNYERHDERHNVDTNVATLRNKNEKNRRMESLSPSNARERERRFALFWKAYPKKQGKDAAREAFARRDPDDALLERMLAAIGRQSQTPQWQNHRFIPKPENWLTDGCWEDEVPEAEIPSIDQQTATMGGHTWPPRRDYDREQPCITGRPGFCEQPSAVGEIV